MSGYNHYSWCVCGWCYKTSSNGYSAERTASKFDQWSAKRFLERNGVTRSWTACFVAPNATCPVCSAKVYFYQNQHGSRVFFDELGWPWPKHPCTDNSTRSNLRDVATQPFVIRARGKITEILEATRASEFDPNAEFMSRYGHSPWDLLVVGKIFRIGFENKIKAKSILPPLDEPVFISFTSAKELPLPGDFFGFDGNEVSILSSELLKQKRCKAKSISQEEFEVAEMESQP